MQVIKTRLVPVMFSFFLFSAAAIDREYISAVGSDSLTDFSNIVASDFDLLGKTRPQIDATGSMLGAELFCHGNGLDTPDFVMMSREMTATEVATCETNQVTPVALEVGLDGIVLAHAQTKEALNLTSEQLFLALSKYIPNEQNRLVLNPNMNWSDVDPELPDQPIVIYGPDEYTGARQLFIDSALEKGCRSFEQLAELQETSERQYQLVCRTLRTDGAWRTVSNTEMAIRNLSQNSDAMAMIPFSSLSQYQPMVQSIAIDSIEPTYETIVSAQYPLQQRLFVYAKKDHVNKVPSMSQFINLYISDEMIGDNGKLTSWGLIPLSDEQRSFVSEEAQRLIGSF